MGTARHFCVANEHVSQSCVLVLAVIATGKKKREKKKESISKREGGEKKRKMRPRDMCTDTHLVTALQVTKWALSTEYVRSSVVVVLGCSHGRRCRATSPRDPPLPPVHVHMQRCQTKSLETLCFIHSSCWSFQIQQHTYKMLLAQV